MEPRSPPRRPVPGDGTAGGVRHSALRLRPGARAPSDGRQAAALHARFRTCRRLAAASRSSIRRIRRIRRPPVSTRSPPGTAPRPRPGTASRPRPRRIRCRPWPGWCSPTGRASTARAAGTRRSTPGSPAGRPARTAPAGTRLATDDWRLCATAEQFLALVSRCDVVVTTRLHGPVPALRTGTPGSRWTRSRAAQRWSARRHGRWAGRRWWTRGRRCARSCWTTGGGGRCPGRADRPRPTTRSADRRRGRCAAGGPRGARPCTAGGPCAAVGRGAGGPWSGWAV
ncbi:polysaccharide pyruvyl transferase family protein [Streptomyces puniciscabiei]|uniref:polysaccharide pyruvyl transferase family protein n=1 Tax=Streptomyces puniciscabiei TaxID=164348 RepID=UPI003328CFAD